MKDMSCWVTLALKALVCTKVPTLITVQKYVQGLHVHVQSLK